jgi:hypothetical protein
VAAFGDCDLPHLLHIPDASRIVRILLFAIARDGAREMLGVLDDKASEKAKALAKKVPSWVHQQKK